MRLFRINAFYIIDFSLSLSVQDNRADTCQETFTTFKSSSADATEPSDSFRKQWTRQQQSFTSLTHVDKSNVHVYLGTEGPQQVAKHWTDDWYCLDTSWCRWYMNWLVAYLVWAVYQETQCSLGKSYNTRKLLNSKTVSVTFICEFHSTLCFRAALLKIIW